MSVALTALAISFPARGFGNPITLTVFGDSLSDVGNLDRASGGALPGDGYFDGRLSNGLLYVDLLGFQISPSLEGGSNYAIAGARTDVSLVGFPSQLESFSEAHPEGADPRGLYLIWFGANDVIDGYEGGDPEAAAMAIGVALSVFGQALSDLIALGAEDIIVLNLPDLSRTPDVLELGDADATALAQALSMQWNAGLEAIVAAQNSPGLVQVDVASLFEEIVADPAAFGITNLEDQAISSPGDDREFLFWDGVHPTARVHRLLAERMQEALGIVPPHYPSIASISFSSASPSVHLTFNSHPQQRYRVEFSTSLTGAWRELIADLPSQGELTSYVDTVAVAAAGGRGFYRVRCAGDIGPEPAPAHPIP